MDILQNLLKCINLWLMSLKKYAKKKGVAQSVVITELISNFIEDAKNENTNNGLS